MTTAHKTEEQPAQHWALILGGSKGLGLATAQKLAMHGFHLLLVHRDRKTDLPQIEMAFTAIRQHGIELKSYNVDALNAQKQEFLYHEIKKALGVNGRIRALVHSIAKGHLKPMYSKGGSTLQSQDIQLTLDAMSLSLYSWAQALISHSLFANNAAIVAFTSEGSSRVLANYSAVSVAKAALEALCRSMAVEFAPLGITVNCIQAGVTDTESMKRIPDAANLLAASLKRNPSGRLTRPEDIANVVYLLSMPEARWITGTIIKADGGESLR